MSSRRAGGGRPGKGAAIGLPAANDGSATAGGFAAPGARRDSIALKQFHSEIAQLLLSRPRYRGERKRPTQRERASEREKGRVMGEIAGSVCEGVYGCRGECLSVETRHRTLLCASPTPAHTHVHAVVSLNKHEAKAVPRKTRLPKLHRSVHPSGSLTHRELTSTTDTSEYPVMCMTAKSSSRARRPRRSSDRLGLLSA